MLSKYCSKSADIFCSQEKPSDFWGPDSSNFFAWNFSAAKAPVSKDENLGSSTGFLESAWVREKINPRIKNLSTIFKYKRKTVNPNFYLVSKETPPKK